MALTYRSSVNQLVDNLDEEKLQEIFNKMKEMISFVEHGEPIE